MKKTCNFYRTFLYILGCIFLAFGITLSTKTGLGVSPIISVPFAIASIWKLNFAAMTFLVYSVLVGIEFILRRPDYHWADLLQIPFSLVFSLLLNFFGNILTMNYSQLWPNLFLLFVAIVFTGIGAAMMVNMNFIRRIGTVDMQLQNGTILPLAQRRVAEIKKHYLAFQMEETL